MWACHEQELCHKSLHYGRIPDTGKAAGIFRAGQDKDSVDAGDSASGVEGVAERVLE